MIKQVHFPESEEFAGVARKRFAFEELFFIQLAVLRERVRLNSEKAKSIPYDVATVQSFVKSLPFTLTVAQRKTTHQILTDLEKPLLMNRLLQGDVGSGKTVVAMIGIGLRQIGISNRGDGTDRTGRATLCNFYQAYLHRLISKSACFAPNIAHYRLMAVRRKPSSGTGKGNSQSLSAPTP